MLTLQVHDHSQEPIFVNIPSPEVGADQILIRVAACALNFADLLMISGTYQETPTLPFTLGMEVAGDVVAVGSKVTNFKVGDRAAAFAGSGGLAELCAVDTSRCLKILNNLSFETAASALISYGTSHLALTHRAKIKPGETLLVLGAAGGVGLTAVEIGTALGARVIAVARGQNKLEVCRARGAEITIDSSRENMVSIIKELGGVDVVYDPVGGDPFIAALKCCKPEARYLTIGFASGNIPQIKANHLLVKNVDVMGFYWGGYLNFAPDMLSKSLTQAMEMIAKGLLKPHISAVYDFDRILVALDHLKDRKSTGKLVIRGPKST
ncbi:MAG TPA: zinc-binding dehydrogenase [Rhodobacteraceae bacterium]|nr:zinc-binding dehydrogenase [Paracoccaceae bacterium]|tara:strand:+ start:115 stop:1086 length:972 start_codon:yes stop_codon:yes gene_type:complete